MENYISKYPIVGRWLPGRGQPLNLKTQHERFGAIIIKDGKQLKILMYWSWCTRTQIIPRFNLHVLHVRRPSNSFYIVMSLDNESIIPQQL